MNELRIGDVGNCKSLDMAITCYKLCLISEKIEKKYNLPRREIWINSPMSKRIMERFKERLRYYDCLMKAIYIDHPKNRLKRRNFDLLIDEIGDIIPSDKYKELPIDVRVFFSQHRHRGVRIFSWTQDYMKVDINYRRMITSVYELQKIIGSKDPDPTKPPIKLIWGFGFKWELDKSILRLDGNIRKKKSVLPEIVPIKKKWIEMYDMTYDIDTNRFDNEKCKCLFCNETYEPVNN